MDGPAWSDQQIVEAFRGRRQTVENVRKKFVSCLTSQCLSSQRIGELKELQEEIGAWSIDVTSTQRGVDWQMKIDDARCKLTSLYP